MIMFSFRVGLLLLCVFLKFSRGQNIPSVNQNQFSKLLDFLKLQVQIKKIGDTLHKECPTLFQHPDVSGFLKPVIGKRQLYYGASWEHLDVRISLAEHTLEFLTQSYLKCKGGPLRVTTQAPDPCYSRPCHNNGTCWANGDTAICACLPGFTGATCDVEINECSSQPCQRGEICVDLVNGYRCICQVGHDGKQCNLKGVDHCRSQPCQNGATCVNGTATYNCICPKTHTGGNCEKRTKCPPGGSLRIGNASMVFEFKPAENSASSWMTDHQPTDLIYANRVWFFHNPYIKTISEFDSIEEMRKNIQIASITLPYNWAGTGQIVYRGNVYFQRAGTQNIVKYDIQKKKIAAEKQTNEMDGNRITCTYHYSTSATDFAVDENGLWLVYGNVTNNCKLVIAKINPDTLNVENSWETDIYSRSVGNTFMKCGVLYGTHYNRDYIRYTYDTNTGKQAPLPPNEIAFKHPKSREFMTMLDYNPLDGHLYYADNSNQGFLATYPTTYSL